MAGRELFDVAIAGAGPAGLAAALYTSRDRYSTLLLEKNGLPGGQIMLTDRIDNYPGIPKVSGADLIQAMVDQVRHFGAEITTGWELTGISREDDGTLRLVINEGELECKARALILAPGSSYRQLGVPGEMELRQEGKVSYCATCDGAFYRDKHVLAVGGGNTAVEDALYLAQRFARKVTLIHRRKEFRAQKVLVEELLAAAQDKNIEIKAPYILSRIVPTGDKCSIDHAELRNVETNQIERVKVDGVFIFVGMVPQTGFLRGVVNLNQHGYIECDPVCLRTNVPRHFCRRRLPRECSHATGHGGRRRRDRGHDAQGVLPQSQLVGVRRDGHHRRLVEFSDRAIAAGLDQSPGAASLISSDSLGFGRFCRLGFAAGCFGGRYHQRLAALLAHDAFAAPVHGNAQDLAAVKVGAANLYSQVNHEHGSLSVLSSATAGINLRKQRLPIGKITFNALVGKKLWGGGCKSLVFFRGCGKIAA